MFQRSLFAFLLSACALCGTVAAQDAASAPSGAAAADDVRAWTSHDGKHTTKAALVGFKTGQVLLKKEDGTTVDVPLEKLSEEDQKYVRRIAEDDPEAVEHLQRRKVETKVDKQGRIQQAHFPEGRRVARRDMEMLLGLPNLQQLTLARCRFSEPAFALLKNMTSLRQLDLSDTIVGNAEVRQLAALKQLRTLRLSGTKITNAALAYVRKLDKLQELELDDTKLGDKGIAHLEKLPELKRLSLHNTKVTPRGVTRLRKALPKAQIEGSSALRRRR